MKRNEDKTLAALLGRAAEALAQSARKGKSSGPELTQLAQELSEQREHLGSDDLPEPEQPAACGDARLFELAPAAFFAFDEIGVITEANHDAAQLLETERLRLVGKPFIIFVASEHQDVFYEHKRLTIATGVPQLVELRLLSNSGNQRSVRIRSIASKVDGVVLCLSVVLDMNELDVVREQLADSVDQDTVLERAPIGFFQTTPGGKFLNANSEMARLYGYESVDELMDKAHIGADIYADPKERDALFAVLHQEGEVSGREYRHVRKDGSTFWAQVSMRAVYDPRGRITRYEGYVTDVSELKRMGASLARSATRNSVLAELSRTILMSASIGEVSDLVLSAAKELTDSPHGFAGYIDPETGQLVCITLTGEMWSGCTVENKRYVFEDYKGLWGWVLENKQPLLLNNAAADPRSEGVPKGHIPVRRFLSVPAISGDGVLLGQITLANSDREYTEDDLAILGSIGDLYGIALERTQTLDQLRRAKRKAEEADHAKTLFLAAMSHEIRTPMNGILGMAEYLHNREMDDERKENIGIIRDSSQHLLTVINDILDFSKIESGGTCLEDVHFDLRGVLNSTKRAFELPAKDKGLTLSLRMDGDVPRYVLGDPSRLRQVLNNLLGNSLKFTETGGIAIRVSSHDPGEEADSGVAAPRPVGVRFAVSDSGIGIPESHKELIFEQFAQAEGGYVKRTGGTGLGLAICRKLVSLMGGEIWVESELGSGSTFIFTVMFGTGDSARVVKEAAPQRPTGKVRALEVLVAEDNPVNALVARKFLDQLGHAATIVGSGEDALSALSQKRFDLVMMDLEMPDMDGLEATRRIRSGEVGRDMAEVPVIAVTAHVFSDVREKCEAGGMDGYLAKPLTMADLRRALAEVSDTAPASSVRKPADQGGGLLQRSVLWERLDGDLELYDELLQVFEQEMPTLVEGLENAAENADLNRIAILGHSLKSASTTIGATSIKEAAVQLEHAALENRLETALSLVEKIALERDAFLQERERSRAF
ncbi:PAS domain-containing hybrid sensor histidine kinase/response regulator [Oceanidesulfovibrio marinus]|uniref:histidine kinase n=1 Tax=Oceanidesulfovibrio marinus TaxID=370038 RepID=A0ABX6NEC5_9BACT|nr:ATP-binding protein [Oceanidesulfovibrio marinus]QJT08959.1 response regulator [Oceanidesulfovibrio marinus]